MKIWQTATIKLLKISKLLNLMKHVSQHIRSDSELLNMVFSTNPVECPQDGRVLDELSFQSVFARKISN